MPDAEAPKDSPPPLPLEFRRRALYILGAATAIGVVLFLAWQLHWSIALVFAAVLVAAFLDAGQNAIRRVLPVGRGAALGIFCVLLLAAGAGLCWFAAAPLSDEIDQLQERLPEAYQAGRDWIGDQAWANKLLGSPNEEGGEATQQLSDMIPSGGGSGGGMMGRVFGAFSTLITAVVSLAFLLVTGLYLAGDPGLYKRGVLWLFPARDRSNIDLAFQDAGNTLRWWIYGQLTAMALVGTLSGLGLWLLGVPLAFVIAVLTFVLCFVPNFGPIASVVPPALLALTAEGRFIAGGPQLALAVVGLYILIQTLESYVITPIIQKKAVELPPALLIVAQLLLGTLLGIVGLVIAAPLTAAGMAISKRLWIEGDVDHEDPRDTPPDEEDATPAT